MPRRSVTIFLCKAVNPTGVWSEEAAAGLVGQTPTLQGTNVRGRAVDFDITIERAWIEDGWVKIDAHFPSDIIRVTPNAVPWWTTDTTGLPVADPLDATQPRDRP